MGAVEGFATMEGEAVSVLEGSLGLKCRKTGRGTAGVGEAQEQGGGVV